MRSTLFLIFMLCFSMGVMAQGKTITGKVIDEQSGEAIPGATILVKNSSKGVITNVEGQYSIEAQPTETLVFSFVGYQTKEVQISNQSKIDISLKVSSALLNELVVVGYGTQQKKNLTGAVGIVTSEEIGNQSVTSAANALSGRVSGVQLIQGSGQPGNDAPTIQIRGVGTVRTSVDSQNDDSAPLVLVDGVQSTLNDVNPNDIESFSVLKDAASASIYGARAANGVILVTTKRGTERKPRVTLNSYMAFQSATATPSMLNPYEFAMLKNEAQTNAGRPILYNDQLLETLKNGSDPRFPTGSYFDTGFRKAAPLNNTYLSITGGGSNVRYMVSAGYQDQQGIVIQTNSKRYNFRSNIDMTINKHVRAGLNIAGSYTNSNEPNYSGYGVTQFVRDMIRYNPLIPEKYENGYWGFGNSLLTSAQASNNVNPIAMAKAGGNDNTQYYRATPNFYLELEPIKDLVFKANASVFYADRKQTKFQNKITVSDGVKVYDTNGLGQLQDINYTENTRTFELTGRYTKKIKDSQFFFLGGLTRQTFRDDYMLAGNQGYDNDILTELDAGTLTPTVQGRASEWALASLFGRVNYDFKGKYLAEFNIRRDGSSRFGDNNRYGTFPSVSVGWNVANEEFLKPIKQINELKFRASWGQLGNQNIGNYASISTISLKQPYVFGNALVAGAAATALSNPNIRWETTTTSDIGIDALFFKYKLSLTADYYIRKSTDLLVSPPIAATLGNLTPPVQNSGEVQNKGYEFSIGYNTRIGNDLSIAVSANWSHNDNKVLNIDSEFISANKVITRQGLPINSFYGYQIAGLFQSDEDAKNATKYGAQPGGVDVRAGDYIYTDVNKDGVVDSDDRVIIGNPNIRNTYGFSLNMDYKGFDFRTLFQGVLGREVENGVYGTDGLRGLSNLTSLYMNRWTPENPNTNIPRVATNYKYNTSLFVGPAISAAILNASYLRMKHLELGYTVPSEIVNKIGFSKVRVYVAGQNLLTFTKFVKGFDPEDATSFNNVNDSYPQAKTWSFGVNLGF